jgi:hypothetical protein
MEHHAASVWAIVRATAVVFGNFKVNRLIHFRAPQKRFYLTDYFKLNYIPTCIAVQ